MAYEISHRKISLALSSTNYRSLNLVSLSLPGLESGLVTVCHIIVLLFFCEINVVLFSFCCCLVSHMYESFVYIVYNVCVYCK